MLNQKKVGIFLRKFHKSHAKQFLEVAYSKGEYRLKYEKNKDYCKLFFDALIPYKTEVFKYVQAYYLCFMQGKDIDNYPKFEI